MSETPGTELHTGQATVLQQRKLGARLDPESFLDQTNLGCALPQSQIYWPKVVIRCGNV